jgi:hypothetical protein
MAEELKKPVEDFQTTPLGLWKRAKQFEEAAKVVAEAAGEQFSPPAYYLWGHSLELSLKAFLFSCGVPLQELKRQYGHNLRALVDGARRHSIERHLYLRAKEIGEIYVLNDEYLAKRFEYHETEDYTLPPKDRMKRLVERFILLLEHTVKAQ